jgi:hypothetical protein
MKLNVNLLEFIYNWVIAGFQWMVHLWLLIHSGPSLFAVFGAYNITASSCDHSLITGLQASYIPWGLLSEAWHNLQFEPGRSSIPSGNFYGKKKKPILMKMPVWGHQISHVTNVGSPKDVMIGRLVKWIYGDQISSCKCQGSGESGLRSAL